MQKWIADLDHSRTDPSSKINVLPYRLLILIYKTCGEEPIADSQSFVTYPTLDFLSRNCRLIYKSSTFFLLEFEYL